MISLPSNFPRRVRIRGGEFGASARAMHRKAAFENVSSATIERKTMSTKTTFKRVALVAVAALGFGLLSVVPSSAGVSQADTLTLASAATTGTLGGTAVAVINQSFVASAAADSLTVTASLVSAPVGSAFPLVLTAGGGTNVNTTGTSPTGFTSGVASTASGYTTGFTTATFTPAVAGTYVVKFTPGLGASNTGTIQAAAVTWTFVVAAEGAATAADSTWGMIAGIATPVQGTHTAISTAKTLPAAQVATIRVTPLKSGGVVLNTAIKLSATITGPGTLGVGTSNSTTTSSSGRAITSAAIGDYTFGVFNDGTAGVSTITITEPGGAVLATATINFADTLASYTLTPTNTVTAVGATDSVAIVGKDAAGVSAALGTYYVSSSNTAVATVVTTGQTGATFLVTGAGAGTAVITVANASSSPTITKTYTVTVGKATIKTLTITTDKTSYAAGEKVTVTVTAHGSDGTAVGDATLNAFAAAVTSNVAVQGTLPTAAIAFVGGVKTFTIYAPMSAGTVVLTGVEGTSTDSVIASSTSGATITASFEVTNPSNDAAVDAANAATDAANYAADAADAATTAAQEATAAAQAAQDSADAATAAVVALGLRVDTLMASVRAQLTSLSNLLVRLIKKAHA